MFGSSAAAQDGTGSVDVEIYGCPEGVDPFDHIDELTAQCVEPSDPIGIVVSNGRGYSTLTGEIGAGEPPQQVRVESVPAGEIAITPQLPDGYDDVSFYCRENDGQVEAIPANLEGGATWNLQPTPR